METLKDKTINLEHMYSNYMFVYTTYQNCVARDICKYII